MTDKSNDSSMANNESQHNRNNSVSLRPGRGPMRGAKGAIVTEKPKDFKGTMKKLLSFVVPFKFRLIIIAFISAVSALFGVIGPKILAKATDTVFEGVKAMLSHTGAIDFDKILRIILVLIVFYALSAVFNYLQSFIMSGITTKMSFNLRNSIIQKTNKLPLSYMNSHSQGDILSRITNDVDTLETSLTSTITQIAASVTTLLGVIIMMLTISTIMTLIVILTVPVSFIVVKRIVKISQPRFKKQQGFLGAVNGHIEEMYGGHTVIKAFGGEKGSIEQFDKLNEQLAENSRKAEFVSGLMMPLMGLIGNLNYVIVCIAGAILTSKGLLTVGGIQAFTQYVKTFNQPITQIGNMSAQIQRMAAAAERVFEYLDETEEDNTSAKYKNIKLNGEITFDHVKFGYEGTGKIVINDFSAHVKPGQKIAIVGPTGAGKTTVVKLLMRYHELNGGHIFADKYDITEIDRHELRESFAMVLQDTWLFSGTIMDNIRYGRLNATDEEVIVAATVAQADHFIRTLPDGYNMEINEETTNISQGQKQLLTIARAVLADPKVLILDEATSSVDTRTELLIQKAMDNLMKGRTSFIIAHRLSTIKNADLILCMDNGDIVEQGTHEELLKANGFYANLYNSQFDKVS